MNLKAYSAWRESRTGLLVFGLAELALAYVFILWSIDSGSLLDYAITFFLIIAAIIDFSKLFKVIQLGRRDG